MAGPTEALTQLPHDNRVIYLGLLSHEDVVKLFQSLDVGVLCIPDDEFGRYCFPQKAYEMLACKLVIISAKVGDMKILLKNQTNHLYNTGDYQDLSQKVLLQLKLVNDHTDIPISDWKQVVAGLEYYLNQLI